MQDVVSSAVAEAAGAAARQEALQLAPQPIGSVVATSAGALNARFILHAVTFDYESELIPTERTLRQLARTALVRCEALGIRRLAVFGSQVNGPGLDPSHVAQLFGFALKEHLVNPSGIQEITLLLPDQRALAAYLSAQIGDSDAITAAVFGDPPLLAGTDPAPHRDGASGHEAVFKRWRSLPSRKVPRPSRPRDADGAPLRTGDDRDSLLSWAEKRLRRLLGKGTVDSLDATEPASVSSQSTTAILPTARAYGADVHYRPLLLERYVLLEEIGRGGMGVVHLSWDLLLRRVVAIKTMRDDLRAGRQAAEKLRQEASVATDLDHEGIVRLYHYEPARSGSVAFIVMEYVSWPTGEQWVADAGSFGLPQEAVRDVGLHLCRALSYAHTRGVLHLDVKPSNIFIDPAGERTKLADFGLARALGNSEGRAIQTHPVGTPDYMAPEQRMPGSKLDARTDVYLLSATLWDLATGSPPGRERRNIRFHSPSVGFLNILAEGLSNDPSSRPSRIETLAERLRTAP
jgi:O-acetyl-ADP-ribose deacetylase (regulator of RNase III)